MKKLLITLTTVLLFSCSSKNFKTDQELYDENHSIYFRGGGSYRVSHFEEWMWRQSVYTRYGDWFVLLCGLFTLTAGGLLIQRSK